jgi:integrase
MMRFGAGGFDKLSEATYESYIYLSKPFFILWDGKSPSIVPTYLKVQMQFAQEACSTKLKRFFSIQQMLKIALIQKKITKKSYEEFQGFKPRGREPQKRTYIERPEDLQKIIDVALSETGNSEYERELNALTPVLLVNLGTRISELLAIKVSDINFDKKLIFIANGKGQKSRHIGCNGVAIEAIKNYLKIRPITDHQELIVQGDGNPYKCYRVIGKKIRRIVRKAGLDLSCHSFRRSNARYLGLDEKLPLPIVAKHLGHGKDLRVLTECYCLTNDFEVTQAVINTKGFSVGGRD